MTNWPALMTRKTVLAYLDMGEAALQKEIATGRLPDGLWIGGKQRWYRNAIDRALEVIAGERVDDYRAEFEARHGNKAA